MELPPFMEDPTFWVAVGTLIFAGVVIYLKVPQMIAGIPRRAARDKAASLLERVGLGERLTHRPARLSGWKDSESSSSTEVEPVRSAEPERSQGTFAAIAFSTLFDALRVAMPFSSASKLGISASATNGGEPEKST